MGVYKPNISKELIMEEKIATIKVVTTRDELIEAFRKWNQNFEDFPNEYDFEGNVLEVAERSADYLIELLS